MELNLISTLLYDHEFFPVKRSHCFDKHFCMFKYLHLSIKVFISGLFKVPFPAYLSYYVHHSFTKEFTYKGNLFYGMDFLGSPSTRFRCGGDCERGVLPCFANPGKINDKSQDGNCFQKQVIFQNPLKYYKLVRKKEWMKIEWH